MGLITGKTQMKSHLEYIPEGITENRAQRVRRYKIWKKQRDMENRRGNSKIFILNSKRVERLEEKEYLKRVIENFPEVMTDINLFSQK